MMPIVGETWGAHEKVGQNGHDDPMNSAFCSPAQVLRSRIGGEVLPPYMGILGAL